MRSIYTDTLICLIGILQVVVVRAQSLPLGTTFSYDSLAAAGLWKSIHSRYLADSSNATGEYKKYIREIYRERKSYIKENFDVKAFITERSAVAYIEKLTNNIIDANPSLQPLKPRLLLYKAWWPNASSLGEGTIFVNIGIIHKYRNEAQLIFTLCHELAHLYLQHSEIAIQKYVNTYYSDDFQKELKRIAKQTYEQNKQLRELEKGITFRSRRHSRDKESEADSVAIEFMRNTFYGIREAKTALAMLDSIDEYKYRDEVVLEKIFDNPSFPFKKSWTKKESDFFGGVKADEKEEKIADSLKTHPDCGKRVLAAERIIARYPGNNGRLFDDEKGFAEWQRKFDFEVIAFQYDRGSLSSAMFQSLQTLQQYPDSSWLYAMVGNCLVKMYDAQKKHILSNFIDLPSPNHEKKYNAFLEFLQNLSLTDLAGIAYYYLDKHKDKGLSNEHFVYALICSKSNFNKPDEKGQWIKYYNENFKNKPAYKF